ncbi:MAG: RAMP superfamily CRISPR-associated protein, partial [Saprospiraceae bacterium]
VVTDALMVDEDGVSPIDGLNEDGIEWTNEYFSMFRMKQLPERDHVRISHKGAAESHGKYDEELVPMGSRFVFELEYDVEGMDSNWDELQKVVERPMFRLGAGTRKGFGGFKVLASERKDYDFSKKDNIIAYRDKSSKIEKIDANIIDEQKKYSLKGWTEISIPLRAESFFLFGSGIGDEHTDMNPKKEFVLDWSNGKPEKKEKYLIPASSIKGALSHRVAYHYNLIQRDFLLQENTTRIDLPELDIEKAILEIERKIKVDTKGWMSDSPRWKEIIQQLDTVDIEQLILESSSYKKWLIDMEEAAKESAKEDKCTGEYNAAVKALFGFAKDDGTEEKTGARGDVIFQDIYMSKDDVNTKILDHIAIDRFTGGTIDGALYQEKVLQFKEGKFIELNLWVKDKVIENSKIKSALNAALKDLQTGYLQLGGNVMKGNGVFLKVNEEMVQI